jgi:hypothetical protein
VCSSDLKKLKASIRKFGAVGGFVWNENTKTLVSGHQRISVLDELNKYPENDYQVKVEKINVDEKTEKEINIALNNRRMQGDFDSDAISKIINDIDLSAIGFDMTDISMFGIDMEPLLDQSIDFESDSEENKIKRKQDVRNHQARIKNERDDKDRGANSFVTLVFASSKEARTFLIKFGYTDDMQFIDGIEFSNKVELLE